MLETEPTQESKFTSKSAETGARQLWNRLCSWWEKDKHLLVQKGFFKPEIFSDVSSDLLLGNMYELMFTVSHLQRAHLLALFVKSMVPKKNNISHLDGKSIKNYVDAIARQIRFFESQNHKLSSLYGNWSWSDDNQYQPLREAMSIKIRNEDKKFRGLKKKNGRTSDSITAYSFRMLIRKTLEKRDKYAAVGDLDHFVKTNASAVVHITMYFCGCRAQTKIADFIITDFKDHTLNCIEFDMSGDFKNRKLTSSYSFVQRESSFILGEFYCDPIRIFLYKRPPDLKINRFFLYARPSARFGDDYWLASKPIGPTPLGGAVNSEIQTLIVEGLIADGTYTNTSLRKGLTDRLGWAGVPSMLIDSAIGHFCTQKGDIAAGFTQTQNLPFYVGMIKEPITRKKLALLLFDDSLSWKDIYNEDDYHQAYNNYFPNNRKCSQTKQTTRILSPAVPSNSQHAVHQLTPQPTEFVPSHFYQLSTSTSF